MTSDNDVFSDNFESKLDEYFTKAYVEGWAGRYQRWDKDSARSSLAITKPPRRASKMWTQAPLGMRVIREPKKDVS